MKFVHWTKLVTIHAFFLDIKLVLLRVYYAWNITINVISIMMKITVTYTRARGDNRRTQWVWRWRRLWQECQSGQRCCALSSNSLRLSWQRHQQSNLYTTSFIGRPDLDIEVHFQSKNRDGLPKERKLVIALITPLCTNLRKATSKNQYQYQHWFSL